MKFERQSASIKESQSQTRVMIKARLGLGVAAADVSGLYNIANLILEDEFTSFAAQFNKYRVHGMRFDIYDINPSAAVFGVFGTYHGPLAEAPTTSGEIIDTPDSGIVPPGTGQRTLYWYATGFDELGFTAVNTTAPNGGLAYYLGGGTAAPKWQVVVSAVVDFRGRV